MAGLQGTCIRQPIWYAMVCYTTDMVSYSILRIYKD